MNSSVTYPHDHNTFTWSVLFYTYLCVVPLGPAVRKSTSLQTQKKEEETRKWASTPKDDVSAIQRAMAAENKVATATRTQSRARTAPKEETKVSHPVLYLLH